MNKEEILARIAQIDESIQGVLANHQSLQQQLQHQANTHTILTGQRAECTFWLAELDKREAEATNAPSSPDSACEDVPQ